MHIEGWGVGREGRRVGGGGRGEVVKWGRQNNVICGKDDKAKQCHINKVILSLIN